MKLALLCLVSIISVVSAQVFGGAVLRGTPNSPNVRGTVTFSLGADGNVTVNVNISGIESNPDGLHGIHVHTFGDLSDPFTLLSAGSHWNVGPVGHGCPEINGTLRHLGDMGNWQATAGSIIANKTLNLLALNGNLSIIGRAVILHNLTDDCVNVPSSGGRLAGGVIGIINSTLFGGSGEAIQGGTTTGAICLLQPTVGSNVSGVVYLVEGPGGVTVSAVVNGITGNHGFHLHWWGDVSAPNGVATGLHYNPLASLHGIPPYQRHKGDMGIISFYDANGVAFYQFTNDALSLNGAYSVVGRAIHVHANSDDCSNPVGNGGPRLAQCVIGSWNNQTVPVFPVGVPTTQNGSAICGIVYATSAASSAASVTSAATAATSAATDSSSAATSAATAATSAATDSSSAATSAATAATSAAVNGTFASSTAVNGTVAATSTSMASSIVASFATFFVLLALAF